MTNRQNCWEFMQCGREPGGARADESGVCRAAAMDPGRDGPNGGESAGRLCWAVTGTYCGDRLQGTFVDKRRSCRFFW